MGAVPHRGFERQIQVPAVDEIGGSRTRVVYPRADHAEGASLEDVPLQAEDGEVGVFDVVGDVSSGPHLQRAYGPSADFPGQAPASFDRDEALVVEADSSAEEDNGRLG